MFHLSFRSERLPENSISTPGTNFYFFFVLGWWMVRGFVSGSLRFPGLDPSKAFPYSVVVVLCLVCARFSLYGLIVANRYWAPERDIIAVCWLLLHQFILSIVICWIRFFCESTFIKTRVLIVYAAKELYLNFILIKTYADFMRNSFVAFSQVDHFSMFCDGEKPFPRCRIQMQDLWTQMHELL